MRYEGAVVCRGRRYVENPQRPASLQFETTARAGH